MGEKMKNAVIVVLLLLVVWLSATVVRLENFRYATSIGYCMEPMETLPAPAGLIERYECLKNKETRTNFLWHLFYALKGDF